MNTIEFSGKSYNANKFLIKLFLKGVAVVKPGKILNNFIKVKNKTITVNDHKRSFSYKNTKKIFPICIGKASVETAITFNKIFKNKQVTPEKGVLVVNEENFKKVPNFTSFVSGHPLPNQNGVKASKYIVKYLNDTNVDDLVLVFISGGGSALLPFPVSSVSLKNKILLNKKLLESGANIDEINTVRKHLSKIKGGNLTKFCSPANVHSLILSDVIGDNLSSISSGLTVADPTTFLDAKKILTKYSLWSKLSTKIKNHIIKGIEDPEYETPKKNDKIFIRTRNTLIGSNRKCLDEIKSYCLDNKIKSRVWKRNVQGDVKKVALEFVEFLKCQKKITPILLISGGETTVKIKGSGKGGRNQELALYISYYMKKQLPFVKYSFLSAGTDGRDGPTDAAGAIIDNTVIEKINEKKIDLVKELKNNNSYDVLKKTNSLILIEGTSTNVADIQLFAIKG